MVTPFRLLTTVAVVTVITADADGDSNDVGGDGNGGGSDCSGKNCRGSGDYCPSISDVQQRVV